MQTFALNSAIDTRRWSQTEASPLEEGPRPEPPAPTREEEQRFQQTSPHPREEREKQEENSE
jgi:hypothetical protein